MSAWQTLYSGLTTAISPALHHWLAYRVGQGKEDEARLPERFGYAGLVRPDGGLVWLHAASVGEVMSVLLLVQKLAEHLPHTEFLITSGTVTSANLLANRLPPRTRHQFMPLDTVAATERFLQHWRPNLALWVESELWPNLLAGLRRHNIPAALLNARLSATSRRNWRYAPRWIAQMLSSFSLSIAQTEAGIEHLLTLGAKQASYYGNLKFAALPLPDNIFSRTQLEATIGNRPVWLFASSHAGEEEIALAAHNQITNSYPDLLTIIVPRHPKRGDEIKQLITRHNLTVAQRSLNELPTPASAIYLADTLGELGVFYRLCSLSVVGGSFVPVGGHNPIEPALLGSACGFGMLMPNFAEVAAAMVANKAAMQLADAAAIAEWITAMLHNPAIAAAQAKAALAYATAQGAVHDDIITALTPVIKQAGLT